MWLLPASAAHTILLDDETQGRTCGLLVITTACGRPSLAGLRFHTVLQPLGQPVRSLSTRGLRWDLSGAALAMGTPDGSRPWQPPSSSNEAVGVEGEGVLREVRVETSEPVVWCVEHGPGAGDSSATARPRAVPTAGRSVARRRPAVPSAVSGRWAPYSLLLLLQMAVPGLASFPAEPYPTLGACAAEQHRASCAHECWEHECCCPAFTVTVDGNGGPPRCTTILQADPGSDARLSAELTLEMTVAPDLWDPGCFVKMWAHVNVRTT